MPGARNATTTPTSIPAGLSGSITFIGTATVLIRFAGFTILTDPNFLHGGERIHLSYGLHARRLTEPALAIHQLPPLDVIVLSHMHEDHFDRVAARELQKDLPIVTTGHADAELRRLGFQQTRSLATWSSQHFTKEGRSLRVTAMPARHAPLALTPFFPSVMGSMLEFTNSSNQVELRVYITGDTLEERVAYLAHGDVYEFRARERTDKAIAPRREPDVFVDGPGSR